MSIEEEKLDYKNTFLIGLTFFATILAWEMYDSQVSISLYKYLGTLALVGLILGLDNLLGLIIQPIVGNLSDNTRSRLGRRIPYLIIGVPFAALFFALIAFETSFFTLFIFIFCFILAMSFYRTQQVALIPDFIKSENRSKANAILNLMGGFGAIVAALISYLLVDISLQLSFIIVSVIMVVTLVIGVLTIKETESYSYQLCLQMDKKELECDQEIQKPKLIDSLKDIASEKDKSTLFILLAIFFVYIGYEGFRALFTIYGTSVLGLTRGAAGGSLLYASLVFLIMALPSAIIAGKFGRKATIKVGLIIFIGAMLLGFFIQNISVVYIVLILIGIGYALVNINTLVTLWSLAPSEKKIGTYTGVYYLFMYTAAILGPGIVGAITDLVGFTFFFLVCSLFLVLALIFMFLVKREEIELTEEEKLEREKIIQELKN
ncbi:MAG: MFS transporter [Candidatus Lokiarchaeota archaeon]|nr:MFS transporter [Candidatus Lokiarchaeota archaeon]MBD3341184.1 MFS transporter [Candidatus Lokiarchaeota archaeon]